MNIHELSERVDRLKMLLDNPEYGLLSWYSAVESIVKELAKEFGPASEKESQAQQDCGIRDN